MFRRLAAALLASALLSPALLCAQNTGSAVKPRAAPASKPDPAIEKARAEQARIYQSRGDVVPPDYVTDRSLLSYSSVLLPDFDRSLARLTPEDRWLDIGAGQGRAILDYYGERYDAMHPEGRERRGGKARAVAMSIEDRRTPEWQQAAARLEPGKIDYRAGRRLREYAPEELGRFRLATDVYGGFSYTSQLSAFMQQVLNLLEVGGSYYTVLINVHPEQPLLPRRAAGYQTEIVDAAGAEVKICAWLRRIGCVEVSCETDAASASSIERYRVRKTCAATVVPGLETVLFEAGAPPVRQFRLAGARPPAP